MKKTIYLLMTLTMLFVSVNAVAQTKKRTTVRKTTTTARKGTTAHKSGQSITAVDLGLSVKWASANLGAKRSIELGKTYRWGETTPESSWKVNTPLSEYSKYKYRYEPGKFTKYCDKGHAADGVGDNKTVLEPEDDAATAVLGSEWRTPTVEEWNELKEKCTWKVATYHLWTKRMDDGISYKSVNVKGYDITGPNGNKIFLPIKTDEVIKIGGGGTDGNNYMTANINEKDYNQFKTFYSTGPYDGSKDFYDWQKPRSVYAAYVRAVHK